MRTPDRLTPLHKRRAEGETRVGSTANPVATSSNPAVQRFKRGGHVEATMKGKRGKGAVSHEDSTGVGALGAKDMRGGSLPDGDEFKKGGKVKHHYKTGGHVKGYAEHGPEHGGRSSGRASIAGHSKHKGSTAEHMSHGGGATRGVDRW